MASTQRSRDKQAVAEVATADPTEYNVEAIARLEQKALSERSLAEKLGDAITRIAGSMTFVTLHVIGFAFWFSANLRLLPGVPVFDPFPFGILTLIVSAEGVFLAIFILISQNRMTRQADRRAQLDLQVSILAEQEMTLMLRMQQKLSEHLGVEVETVKQEAQRLMRKTDVQELVSALEDKLPEQ